MKVKRREAQVRVSHHARWSLVLDVRIIMHNYIGATFSLIRVVALSPDI